MTANWEQLLCPFFSKVSLCVLGDYFQQHGFQVSETKIGGLLIHKDTVFVEVSYDPQTYPDYSPVLNIGIGKEKFDKSGKPTGVPLWFVLPEESDQRCYSFWKFRTEQELNTAMEHILNQIIKLYMEPLWSDLSLLYNKIENFKIMGQ